MQDFLLSDESMFMTKHHRENVINLDTEEGDSCSLREEIKSKLAKDQQVDKSSNNNKGSDQID